MEPMHVCYMNDSFPPAIDGVANAVTNYAGIFHEHYGKSTVVTPYYPDADDTVYPYPVLRYPSIDTTKLIGYRAGVPYSMDLMSRLESDSFQLIHCHCPMTSMVLARALRDRCKIPLVFTYHTKFAIDIANALRSKLLREEAVRYLVQNISACDEVWTVSRGAGENLRSLGYQGEYLVMPNGVDFPCGRVSAQEVEAATAEAQLPSNVPLFLFVGRLMWYKGIRIILDALRMLQEQGIAFRMVLIGKGGDEAEIRDYVQKLGLTSVVSLLGPIYDRQVLRAWYCRADAFLFPSTFDTNGLVVHEAAACALPSVLVRGSCAAEDVADGRNGFLIEENAESMAKTLKTLCAAPQQMKQVGQAAQRELYLSWEDALKQAVARYQVVIDRYAAGKYPPKEPISPELYRPIAEVVDAYNRMRKKQKELWQEISGSYAAWRSSSLQGEEK